MNSNLFGSPFLSAGLSKIQMESFRSRHVVFTVMAENIPQLLLQSSFMFQLNLFTTTVIASFISSIFNILFAIMAAAVFWILYRNQEEVPFSLTISYTDKQSDEDVSSEAAASKEDEASLDPQVNCGHR